MSLSFLDFEQRNPSHIWSSALSHVDIRWNGLSGWSSLSDHDVSYPHFWREIYIDKNVYSLRTDFYFDIRFDIWWNTRWRSVILSWYRPYKVVDFCIYMCACRQEINEVPSDKARGSSSYRYLWEINEIDSSSSLLTVSPTVMNDTKMKSSYDRNLSLWTYFARNHSNKYNNNDLINLLISSTVDPISSIIKNTQIRIHMTQSAYVSWSESNWRVFFSSWHKIWQNNS